MTPDPKKTLIRWYYAHKIVSILVDHAHEIRGETVASQFPEGLPSDHDGWEHDLYRLKAQNPVLDLPQQFEHMGRFTNLGLAIKAARDDGKPPEGESKSETLLENQP